MSATQIGIHEDCDYTYDSFGNRLTSTAGSNGGCYGINLLFSSQNYISGYCYDAAGDLLDVGACPASGVHQYIYDAEGRLSSSMSGQVTYTYDAEGHRIGTTSAGGALDTIFDSVTGEPVAHYLGGFFNNQNLDFWFNGKHLGYLVEDGSGNITLTWSTVDALGNERQRMDSNGNQVGFFENLPFGDGQETLAGSDNNATHFTGKERDTANNDLNGVSGLDYFGARFYSSAIGRFMSPDWASDPTAVPYATYTNPQRLNLYNYMRNNPLSGTDPDGHCCDPDSIIISTTTVSGSIIGGLVGATAGAGGGDVSRSRIRYSWRGLRRGSSGNRCRRCDRRCHRQRNRRRNSFFREHLFKQ